MTPELHFTFWPILGNTSKTLIFIDKQVWELHHIWLKSTINQAIWEIIPGGEASKSWDVLESCLKLCHQHQIKINDFIVGIGGGTICDLAALTASLWKRGTNLILVPTTLLAMVDAAHGGKTGINWLHTKNSIGTFYQAKYTWIQMNFLNTLPANELQNGWVEMAKHGLVADKEHWKEILQCELQHLKKEDIFRSAHIKIEIVNQDMEDKGIRQILNAGHTWGHAFESASHQMGEPLSHGEAIALGLFCELMLSQKKTLLLENEVKMIQHELVFRFPRIHQWYGKFLMESWNYLFDDKKNRNEGITFSLIGPIGKASWNHTFTLSELKSIFVPSLSA